MENPGYKMDDTLINSLQSIHDANLHWEQDPVVINNGILVQLCHAIGKDATTPPNALNQPDLFPKKLQVDISLTPTPTKA